MIAIKILYNGKEYPLGEASGAIHDIANKVFVSIIEKKLEPFRGEVERSGGSLTIRILGELKADVVARDLPEELVQRIQASAILP